ncbi:MAG: hypothetical protein M3140_08580, partial [Actinomycetota bacterium]|nr:hypothetical protein [Actinomycetota bacterium]
AEPAQGSTTVAALLATALAARRFDPVLVVDAGAAGWHPSLHQMLGATPVKTIRTLAAEGPRPTSRRDFADALTPVADGVWLVPGDDRARTTGGAAPDAGTYTAAVSPFARYFDITVTDLSSRPGQGAAELLLDRAHALCLVTSQTDEGFAGVTSRLADLRDRGGAPWAGRTVVVANHTDPRSGRRRRPRRIGKRIHDVSVVNLDFDPALRPGFPAHIGDLGPLTHLAAMRLAAEVLGTAIPVAS